MKKSLLAVSVAVAISFNSVYAGGPGKGVELNPDPDSAYSLAELQTMTKTPVFVRTVLGGDYGQEPVDLMAFFLHVDQGFGNGQTLVMQTDPADPRWKDVGVAAGMSGSPIYDPATGKMLGALSYGGDTGYEGKILFIATPIELMNESLFPYKRKWNLLIADNSECNDQQPSATGFNRLLPITISGMSEGLANKALKNQIGYRLNKSGSGNSLQEVGNLQAGSSIAVSVVTGDAIQMYAIGTATTVFEGKVLAFGHPFFQIGEVNYPFCGTLIYGIDHGPYGNNKNGVITGSRLGVITQDGRVGIAGEVDSSVKLDIIPVYYEGKKNGQKFIFDHQVSKIETYGWNGDYTNWIVWTLMSSVDQSFGTIGPQTAEIKSSLKIDGYEKPINITNWVADSYGGTAYSSGFKIYYLLNEAKNYGFKIKSVDFSANLYEKDYSFFVDKVEIIGRIISGAPMHLKIEAHTEENPRIVKDIYLDIPVDAQGKSIEFIIGSAADIYENKELPARPTLKQWAKNIAQRGTEDQMVIKMKIYEPLIMQEVQPDPTVIIKKVPLNKVVVSGMQTIYGVVENDLKPTQDYSEQDDSENEIEFDKI